MKLSSLYVDDKGESYFGEVECANPPGSNKEREQDVAYWQIWETQPGHFQDFKPTPEPRCLAVLSGKLEVTASTGEKRYFSRGDTFLMQDLTGKGHAVRTLGWEPCNVLLVTMKQTMAPAGTGEGRAPGDAIVR
ncbi:MAG: DUF861 domain-containing protein [Rhodospirillaceae bacterium]|nr:DUF861 domain-containing protein [Rhodospirillaceae bacterium]